MNPPSTIEIGTTSSWFSLGIFRPELDQIASERSFSELIEHIETSHRVCSALISQEWLQVRVERVEDESDEVRSFYLTPTNNRPLPKFIAGQHILVSNSGHQFTEEVNCNRKSLSRCYTLSNTANPRYWRISVKRQLVPEQQQHDSLSNYLHQNVKVGDHLQVKGPRGSFTVERAGQAPVLLFGAGVGITPVIAMASELAQQQGERSIWIFYQTQTPENAALADELIRLAQEFPNVSVNIAFSKIQNVGKGNRSNNIQFFGGRVGPEKLSELTPHFQSGHCFLCGPSKWMTDTIEALQKRGFSNNRIHYESFGSTLVNESQNERTETTNGDAGGFAVNCRESKVSINFQGSQGSLLDQLQRAGADVAGGCRVGNCGTCMTKLLRGKIQAGQTNCDDLQEGWILPCVATPESDIEIQV